MDINEFFTTAGHEQRPDHPDFWRLSEIILELKGELAEANSVEEQGRRWEARYAAVGDFPSIKYCAVQAAIQIMNIQTGQDLLRVKNDQKLLERFVGTIQAYFDGFIMGAEFERRGGHQEAAS